MGWGLGEEDINAASNLLSMIIENFHLVILARA